MSSAVPSGRTRTWPGRCPLRTNHRPGLLAVRLRRAAGPRGGIFHPCRAQLPVTLCSPPGGRPGHVIPLGRAGDRPAREPQAGARGQGSVAWDTKTSRVVERFLDSSTPRPEVFAYQDHSDRVVTQPQPTGPVSTARTGCRCDRRPPWHLKSAQIHRWLSGHVGASTHRSATGGRRHTASEAGAVWRSGVEVTAVGWALTIGVIVALLALDLLLATVRPHEVGYREATAWSVFYIVVAVAFGLVFASLVGWKYGAEYFAGYIVEKSLSVDNLFVFVIIMATFAVPREHQQRVLIFGIIAALALRAVFIALGAALLSLLSFMFLLFGLLLIWTAVRLYRHRAEDPDVLNSALVRSSRRIVPVSDTYAGGRLIARAGGRRVVTPLFIVFIAIAGTDILFALDSIPAVFGVTDQPYIV